MSSAFASRRPTGRSTSRSAQSSVPAPWRGHRGRDPGATPSPLVDALERRRASLVRVRCRPGSNLARPVQQFVSRYARGRFRNVHADAISLATFELLDNALNFGSISHDVLLELFATSAAIDVAVSNHAAPARISMLSQQLERIRSTSAAAYAAEVKRGSSGDALVKLGLARVTHDARMALRLSTDDEQITVTARLLI